VLKLVCNAVEPVLSVVDTVLEVLVLEVLDND
jgi:hypothetical protein